jgi:hypothetical protein
VLEGLLRHRVGVVVGENLGVVVVISLLVESVIGRNCKFVAYSVAFKSFVVLYYLLLLFWHCTASFQLCI